MTVILIENGAADEMLKSHVKGYTRKDGTFVKEHDDSRQTKSSGSGSDYKAPAEGDVGHEEHSKYGVYHRRGDTVKDNYGKSHIVRSHHGPVVTTMGGEEFHPTKLHHVRNVDPAAEKAASAHDDAADSHYTTSSHAARHDDDKGARLHDKAGSAHEAAARAHRSGAANAAELSAAAKKASEAADASYDRRNSHR